MTEVSQSLQIQSQGVTDASLLEEYLKNFDSGTLKEMWKTKRVQEKMNKRQQSHLLRVRYQNEDELIAAIENALRTASTLKEAAAMMNVHVATIKKWAKLYFPDLLEAVKKPGSNQGSKKGVWWEKGKYPMKDVLAGKFPNYPVNKLRERLIYHEVFPFECSQCGFKEERLMSDEKNTSHYKHARKPILLDFIDGDTHNQLASNLRFLCYNCYFLLVGNLIGPRKKNVLKQMIKKAKVVLTDEEAQQQVKKAEEQLKKENENNEKT
jgi:hypothetical protein